VAHAEASAKTVDAAVTAAATQLGLRSDQVDIEVLEDPVPSTFGYIGTPARVRVTPRSGSAPDTPGTLSATAPPAGVGPAGVGTADVGPAGATSSEADASTPTADASGQAASGPAATAIANQAADARGASSSPQPESAQAATSAPSSAPAPADIPTPGDASAPADAPVPGDVPTPATESLDPATSPPSSLRDPAATTPAGAPTSASDSPPHSDAASVPASPSGSASALTSHPAPALDPDPASGAAPTVTQGVNDSNLTSPSSISDPSAPSVAGVGTGSGTGSGGEASAGFGVGSGAGSVGANSVVDPGAGTVASDEPTPSIGTPEAATVAASPTAQPSSTTAPGGNGDRASEVETTRGSSPLSTPPAAPPPPGSESPSTTRPPRRTYRDEPIEPEMVEADTERAGDFLEGLLDALDVDGDITTWVDEVGGHIDLEGTDLDVLVGSNGETLDALQELTRLAVLRQSKRRVRLLLDINGFRARQRERLVTIVKATAEQVIRTREDHEFQPMSPAERKIVHDAVAAIDGARTESLGEDPHRRVVIRPT
jgi:spoIIIJ-associated protein